MEMNVQPGASVSRKEKRKAAKKAKRGILRRQAAEASKKFELEEQVDLKALEKQQQEIEEMEKKKHDEEEKAWLEREERAKKEAALRLEQEEEKAKQAAANGGTYLVEDNLVWIGNNITITKARPSGSSANRIEPKERPPSTPRPPLQLVKNEASNICESLDEDPAFGTEQDKNFCPFHYKTGACRFSNTCRRAHVYPQKSCTLLMKNMYTGPGLAWEHDEALEYTDKEVEQHYEEFYEDVHSEFLKFGELVNFKVARNGAAHLRGNVYVHYKHEECAIVARNAFLGRFFGGRQIMPEFVGVKKWKQALCGVYMRNLQGCSHGVNCNFLHCFRNPGGEYEWADWDSPPPRSWQKKMATLFGYPYEEPEDSRKSEKEERRRSRCRSQDSNGRSKHDRETSRSRGDREDKERYADSGRHRPGRRREDDFDDTKDKEWDEGSGKHQANENTRRHQDRKRNEDSARHQDRRSRRNDVDDRSSRQKDESKDKDELSRSNRKHGDDRKSSSSRREGRYDDESGRSRRVKRRGDERSYASNEEYKENSRSSRHQKIIDDEYERWQGS